MRVLQHSRTIRDLPNIVIVPMPGRPEIAAVAEEKDADGNVTVEGVPGQEGHPDRGDHVFKLPPHTATARLASVCHRCQLAHHEGKNATSTDQRLRWAHEALALVAAVVGATWNHPRIVLDVADWHGLEDADWVSFGESVLEDLTYPAKGVAPYVDGEIVRLYNPVQEAILAFVLPTVAEVEKKAVFTAEKGGKNG